MNNSLCTDSWVNKRFEFPFLYSFFIGWKETSLVLISYDFQWYPGLTPTWKNPSFVRVFFFFDFYFLLTILKLDLTNFIFLLQNKNVFQPLSSTVSRQQKTCVFSFFTHWSLFYWIYFYVNNLLVIRATPANSVHIVNASCISGCQSWTISQPPDCLPQAGSHFPLLLPGLREEGKQVLQSTGLPKVS